MRRPRGRARGAAGAGGAGVIDLAAERIAAVAGAEIAARGGDQPPRRAVVDSREVRSGDLFVGLRGEDADGGDYAAAALEGGAWGMLVTEEHAAGLDGGWVLPTGDPL